MKHGFITPDEGGRDVFVHHSGIEGQSGFRTLTPGDRVKYTLCDNGRGPQARQVRRVGMVVDDLPPLGPGEGVEAVKKIAARWIDWAV